MCTVCKYKLLYIINIKHPAHPVNRFLCKSINFLFYRREKPVSLCTLLTKCHHLYAFCHFCFSFCLLLRSSVFDRRVFPPPRRIGLSLSQRKQPRETLRFAGLFFMAANQLRFAFAPERAVFIVPHFPPQEAHPEHAPQDEQLPPQELFPAFLSRIIERISSVTATDSC